MTEPVFIASGQPIHVTEYRRLHSDPDGDPKVTIRIDVWPPEALRVGLYEEDDPTDPRT